MKKIPAIFFISSISITIVVISLIYYIGREKITNQIKLNLENQAKVMISNINMEDYKKLVLDPTQKDGNQLYKKTVSELKSTHDILKDKDRYVYTLFYRDNKVVFGLDTSDRGDLDQDGVEDHADLFSEYTEIYPEVKANFQKNNIQPVLTEVYTDKWGSFISYYYPIIYKDQFLGYLGIDMKVDVFLKDINELKQYLLMIFTFLSVLSVGGSVLTYMLIKSVEKRHLVEIELRDKEQELEMAQVSKLAVLGEFASMLTHEINNPLQSILGNAEMIDMLAENPDEASKVKEFANNIMNSFDKIQDIIKSTKSLIRNDSSDSIEEINLTQVVKNTEPLYLSRIKKLQINYSVEVPDEVKILGYASQLQQVILNMVNNASFAIQNLEEKWIKIKYSETPEFHIFSVIDSGNGLSEEIQKNIKKKFFSTKKNGEGSGLGLSICRKILFKHSGDFYYNPDCKNTCFEFKIPKIEIKSKAA